MKKGESYNCFYAKDKPKHPIVKALKEKYGNAFDEGYLVYASTFSDCCGWTIDGYFINYTIKSSVKCINDGSWYKNMM
jgi:hypothetical protein